MAFSQEYFQDKNLSWFGKFYRKFIKNFNAICALILGTIKKDKYPFQWIEMNENGFHLLKRNIIEQPILTLLYFNKLFQSKFDASGMAIGVVLSHEDKPVAHYSEKLNEAK